jgi:hypothetical protein
MIHTKVKTYQYRKGKNSYIVIQIFQSANASALQRFGYWGGAN